MGRTKPEILRVRATAGGRRSWPCFQEMMTFMACLKRCSFNDEPCALEKGALNSCMDLQASQGKPRTTLNYHLQRIAKTLKR